MVNKDALRKSFQRIKKDIFVLDKKDDLIADEIIKLRKEINQLREEVYDQSFTEKLADSIIEKMEEKLELNNLQTETINEEKPETVETKPETETHNNIPNHIDSTMFLKQKIKKKIVKLCRQRVRPGNLKRTVVDIAKLCSKATFYRYLSELKRDGFVQAIEINNEAFLVTSEKILDRNIYK